MKLLLKGGFLILLASLFLCVGITAGAESEALYSVRLESGEYRVYTEDEPILNDSSLSNLIERAVEVLDAKCFYFSSVSTSEDLKLLRGDITFSGSIAFYSNANLINAGATLTAANLFLEFDQGGLKLERGAVYMHSGSIHSDSAAVLLDYSAGAYFELGACDIVGSSYEGAIVLSAGTLKVKGGSVKNNLGFAINSSANLILTGAPQILGCEFDIYTTAPITLFDGASSYFGEAVVQYGTTFANGSSTEVFRCSAKDSCDGITLFDAALQRTEITYLASKGAAFVHLPFSVRFYDRGALFFESEMLVGEVADKPSVAPSRVGYDFLGWSLTDGGRELYEFATGISADLNLYSVYKLKPPSFTLSSMDFTYDGTMRFLSLEELEHPFLNDGLVGCEWYKDGKSLSKFGDKIGVRSVSDSGEYKCKITFSVGSDSVTVFTPTVDVRISKAVVDTPTIPSVSYNGDYIYPDIFDTIFYTVHREAKREVGIYPIVLTLIDSENYRFSESNAKTVEINFEIRRAANYWRESLSASNVYEGEAPKVNAIPAFGSVRFLYSNKRDGNFTDTPQAAAGSYYVKACVEGNENYSSLESSVIEFSVIREEILGISVVIPPDKREYSAFESFDGRGMTVGVSYNSGRQMTVDYTEVSFFYQSADSFRFGDSGVLLSFGGASVMFPVNVKKAEYDLSGIRFEDSTAFYGGDLKSVAFSGVLPIGLDGIQLSASISGGGINVGEYTSKLSFSTESQNYAVPEPLVAKITVLPYESTVVWESQVFTYDGTPKLPTAYFIDVLGRKRTLTVSGARIYAGSYTAEADCKDSNYSLLGTSCEFTVAKAEYDMSSLLWSAVEYVYDGTEKRVAITSGLPDGVSVIGYANNKASESGSYVATVSFGYDSANYLPPVYNGYEWRIERAEYPTDTYSFSDVSVIYDGAVHYPIFNGYMPIGIDSSSPTYSFSGGVRDALEGRVRVEITFKTDSKNYKAPPAVYAYVEILPIEIEVVWNNLIFTYNGNPCVPSATAPESDITVSGAMVDAGEYTAIATARDTNYSVKNRSVVYKIGKADNYWIEEIFVKNQYASREPTPIASAYRGEVEFWYYTDAECKHTAESFDLPGTYYAVAYTEGDSNHKGMKSLPFAFEMLEVLPIGIEVEIVKSWLVAFDKLNSSDFTAQILYNDGSITPLASALVEVSYQGADSLRASDKSVSFYYGDFSFHCDITVKKARYDLTGVRWDRVYHTYDGTEKNAVLCGLPDGVEVIEYYGNGNINAGQYTVSAKLFYDAENYEEPVITPATLEIMKCTVPVPKVYSTVYDGSAKEPIFDESDLYTVRFFGGAIRAGSYNVSFVLSDDDNYCFSDGGAEVDVPFYINRRAVRVKICDDDFYFLEREVDLGFEIVGGSPASGDVITPSYHIEGDGIYADFYDPDYDVSVIPGKIIRQSKLSPTATLILAVIAAVLSVGSVFIFLILKYRKRLYFYYNSMRLRYGGAFIGGKDFPLLEGAKLSPPPERPLTVFEPKGEAAQDSASSVLTIDAEYADTAITNDLAKNLIRHDSDVETYGWRRRTVNVDLLSRSFLPGERVDVNSLKEKGLVPRDTAYIRVMARGIIDKPLCVYANEFTPAAVKMIALSGGKAVKVGTVKLRKNRGREK